MPSFAPCDRLERYGRARLQFGIEPVNRFGDTGYRAVGFESDGHDGWYTDAGVCIDLNGDDEREVTTEIAHHGDVVRFPSGSYTLRLDYP
jgi:hypothetical protein